MTSCHDYSCSDLALVHLFDELSMYTQHQASIIPKRLIRLSTGSITLLMSLWSSYAVAQTKPVDVFVVVDDVCATTTLKTQFLKELSVRLPEKTTFLKAANSDQPHWTVRWTRSGNQTCQVQLSDINPVMTMALNANAEANQIRDVLVRLIWTIKTVEPKFVEKIPETKPVPEKKVEKKPAETDKVDNKPLKEPEAPEDKSLELKRATTQPVGTTPTPGTRQDKDQLLSDVTAALSAFRAQRPNLFGDVEVQRDSSLTTSLFGARTSLGMYTALSTKVTTFHDKPAWLTGLSVSALLGRRLSLGVSLGAMVNELRFGNDPNNNLPKDDPNFINRDRVFFYAGSLDVEYLFFPEERIHLGIGASVGPGLALWDVYTAGANGSNERDTVANTYMVFDANAHIYYDLFSWMQLGVGFGWRNMYNISTQRPEPDTASGPSGNFSLRIGLF